MATMQKTKKKTKAKKVKAKKIGTIAAIGAGIRGLREMQKRGVKTPGQKIAEARVKKRVTGVPKVTRRRMKKAGNP